MRRWAPLMLLVVTMIACGPDAKARCSNVFSSTLLYRADADRRDAFVAVTDSAVSELRRRLVKADSATAVAINDSLAMWQARRMPDVTPPPSPSEVAWSNEHCFEGRPR